MYTIYQTIEKLQFIPRIANTHYYYQIYENPITAPTKKTSDIQGTPQVKTPNKKLQCNKNESATLDAQQSTAPTTQPTTIKGVRKKYRKNINKQALAEYFDNSDKYVDGSHKNEESQQWLDDVIAELNRQDANRRAEKAKDQKILCEFGESITKTFVAVAEPDYPEINYRYEEDTYMDEDREFRKTLAAHNIIVATDGIIDVIKAFQKIILEAKAQKSANKKRKKINADILDKFERRMQHISQARGMKKMYDMHKLRHQIQK